MIIQPHEKVEENDKDLPQGEDVEEVDIAGDGEQRYPQRVQRPLLWMEDYAA